MIILAEGDGERQSLPILLRRSNVLDLPRIIDMRGKSNIIRLNRGFEDTIRRQVAQGERTFIVLLDADVTFPPYTSLERERDDMVQRAEVLSAQLRISVQVFWAVLTSESWLIGGLRPGATYCSLRRVGRVAADTEANPPNPKQWLQVHLREDYLPRTQACLAQNIDLEESARRNRSMQLFLATFSENSGGDLP